MILITKDEYELLKQKLGKDMLHIAVTSKKKKSKRKKRYIEESRRVTRALREIRNPRKKEVVT